MASVLDSIFGVFTEVGTWLGEAVNALTPLFYKADTGLTFLGTLAVAGLGFSVIFLILGIIQKFLHFRG